jgi:acyl-CoA synthetase (NDP forming)
MEVEMIEPTMATEFLAAGRIAVIGASDTRGNFGNTVYRALRDHAIEVVAVNPRAGQVAGDTCYPDVSAVPGTIDCAIVMVPNSRAADVVAGCLDHGVPRIWLFKGLGSQGAVSEAAIELCAQRGVPVVAGACPLMFLEPVGWPHRLHRFCRRLNNSLAAAP